ncbi:ribosomal RNA large subunit methyltransferase E-like isoform X2 [Watersipora subatra]|uniref:ribosomal RNA large subunit methyltransferase E-like isoform X2 n=1 Tax=Watersipora subatra TaxID=2589382 RepID=UPI00355BE473
MNISPVGSCSSKLVANATFKQLCRYSSSRKISLQKTSSRQWLIRQMNDKYVKLARYEHYRCRSAFKLLEIDEKYKILEAGMSVLDCGAAPGSWSQVAAKLVNSDKRGFIVSIDRDFFHKVEGCVCIRNADFTQKTSRDKVIEVLGDKRIDCALSDMAPNATGHKLMDHEQIIDLQVKFVEFSELVLRHGGTLLCKILEGNRTKQFTTYLETLFDDVKKVKPDASRSNSAEIFVLGRGYKRPR